MSVIDVNYELYNYLIANPNVTLNLRWYDAFGAVEIDGQKFQKVHISNMTPRDAYDIVFKNCPVSGLLDENIEELCAEVKAAQEKALDLLEDDFFLHPVCDHVLITADVPTFRSFGERFSF